MFHFNECDVYILKGEIQKLVKHKITSVIILPKIIKFEV